ncbi:prepilin peptidase [Pseudomonas sp. EA_65y_Pfl1_P120]
MGLFLVGLLAGLPVSAVAVRLPYAVKRQWLLDASGTLGNVRGPNCAGRLGMAWRPDHLSLRVGLTMLGMGLLSGWAGLHYGVGLAAFAAIVLAAGLLTLSLIDLDHQLLPDVLVLPLLWLGLIVNSVELFTSLTSAVWGAVGGYLLLWIFRGVSNRFSGTDGMGQGDLKMMAMLGAWGGWQILPGVFVLSSLVGTLVAGVWIAAGKIDRRNPIPFGPFLAAAGWLALLYSPDWAAI